MLTINYWPEVTGIGAFSTYRAEYLAAAGHQVQVCTTFPYYPEWKVPAAYAGRLHASETRKGVSILRSCAYIPHPPTALKRIVHEASFLVSSLVSAAFQKRPQLLLVVSPPLGLALNAILLGRLWGIPYVFDVEDMQPDAAADLKMLPSWVIRLLYLLESAAYRHAALVTTITHGMRQRIVAKGIPPEKVALIEPRVEDALLSLGPEPGLAFRLQHGLENKFLVTHSGNMGVKQGLEVIVAAAALSRGDESILYLLVGDGAAKAAIERRAALLGLANIRFLPLLSDADFRGLLSATDLFLLTQQKSVSDQLFPSKLVTYLAAGRPVVASVNSSSEAAQVIVESEAGLVVEPEDPHSLLGAIQACRGEDPAARRRNARAYAERRWSCSRVLGQMERTLISVVKARQESPAPEDAAS